MIRSIITLLFSLGRKDGFGAKNKKGALVPQWDESACFRGATHFQRPAGRPSFCLLLREGDRARLRARWWDCLRPLLAVGRLQPVASLSVRRCWGVLMSRRGGERNNIIPRRGNCQPFSPYFCGAERCKDEENGFFAVVQEDKNGMPTRGYPGSCTLHKEEPRPNPVILRPLGRRIRIPRPFA